MWSLGTLVPEGPWWFKQKGDLAVLCKKASGLMRSDTCGVLLVH